MCFILYLCVDHGDGDPVVAPEEAALGTELAELLKKKKRVKS